MGDVFDFQKFREKYTKSDGDFYETAKNDLYKWVAEKFLVLYVLSEIKEGEKIYKAVDVDNIRVKLSIEPSGASLEKVQQHWDDFNNDHGRGKGDSISDRPKNENGEGFDVFPKSLELLILIICKTGGLVLGDWIDEGGDNIEIPGSAGFDNFLVGVKESPADDIIVKQEL